jgi:hypothetical protein
MTNEKVATCAFRSSTEAQASSAGCRDEQSNWPEEPCSRQLPKMSPKLCTLYSRLGVYVSSLPSTVHLIIRRRLVVSYTKKAVRLFTRSRRYTSLGKGFRRQEDLDG